MLTTWTVQYKNTNITNFPTDVRDSEGDETYHFLGQLHAFIEKLMALVHTPSYSQETLHA